MMVKKLSAVGNSLGLIIERPILDLLDITKDTPLDVRTDGEALIIRPFKKAPLMDRALAVADRLVDAHEETYRKLAKRATPAEGRVRASSDPVLGRQR